MRNSKSQKVRVGHGILFGLGMFTKKSFRSFLCSEIFSKTQEHETMFKPVKQIKNV